MTSASHSNRAKTVATSSANHGRAAFAQPIFATAPLALSGGVGGVVFVVGATHDVASDAAARYSSCMAGAIKRQPLVSIRDAHSAERELLEDLQRRASPHSSTYRDQLLGHPDAIELPATQIDEGLVRVAERSGVPVGFHVLLCVVDGACELDGLFVEPELWRSGIGRLLIQDAVAIARQQHATFVDVTANLNAIAFYQRVGFIEGNETATLFGPARRMRKRVAN
jgi:GNAT superfamily N-acetyltransferase